MAPCGSVRVPEETPGNHQPVVQRPQSFGDAGTIDPELYESRECELSTSMLALILSLLCGCTSCSKFLLLPFLPQRWTINCPKINPVSPKLLWMVYFVTPIIKQAKTTSPQEKSHNTNVAVGELFCNIPVCRIHRRSPILIYLPSLQISSHLLIYTRGYLFLRWGLIM